MTPTMLPDEPTTPEPDVVPDTPEEAAVAAEPTPDAAESAPAEAAVAVETATGSPNKRWYVVKVQSGREESIKEAIERRVKIEGLDEFYGQTYIPVEKITEMRRGKRVVKERKKFPGYLMVEVEFNDRMLYLFRETSGVGDFVGGNVHRPPTPMTDTEVKRLIRPAEEPGTKEVLPDKSPFEKGDRVKVRDGTFSGMEGEVKDLLESKGQVRVNLTIFGREVPVELEYWQVEGI